MDFPSGDQAGSRSTTSVVFVKLRMSPFSAGTVRISPRTPKTARAPVGEMPAKRIRCGSIFWKCGRTSARSPVMLDVQSAHRLPDLRSSRWSEPNCS